MGKFKIESHNAQAGKEQKARPDPRMEYFEDYASPPTPTGPNKLGSSKNIRAMYGSADKLPRTRDYL